MEERAILESHCQRLANYLQIETPKVDLINSFCIRYPLLLAREGLWGVKNGLPPDIVLEQHFCSLAYAAMREKRPWNVVGRDDEGEWFYEDSLDFAERDGIWFFALTHLGCFSTADIRYRVMANQKKEADGKLYAEFRRASLEKEELETQIEALKDENAELMALLDEATAPENDTYSTDDEQ
jgi:hypothetical protein